MTSSVTFRAAAPLGARLGMLGVLLPVVLLGLIALLFKPPAMPWLLVAVTALPLFCALCFVAVWRAVAVLRVSDTELVLGFFPLWRTRIPRDSVAHVETLTVNPWADYRGWGIKGSATSPKGRLYSAGGCHAVLVRTTAGKTYLVAFDTAATARDAAAAIWR